MAILAGITPCDFLVLVEPFKDLSVSMNAHLSNGSVKAARLLFVGETNLLVCWDLCGALFIREITRPIAQLKSLGSVCCAPFVLAPEGVRLSRPPSPPPSE